MKILTEFVFLIGIFSSLVVCDEYFSEDFADGMERWTRSKISDDLGYMVVSKRKIVDSDLYKGLKTTEDSKVYHYSAPFVKPFVTNEKHVVVQFSLQHEQELRCGGGYIKLLLENEPEKFNAETPYGIMFGPDSCGSAKKIHLIFSHNGKNILKTDSISFTNDRLIHVYYLHISPDKKYEVYVDDKLATSGSIQEEWNLFGEKLIDDPNDVKPEDYDDNKMITDPNAKKPEDWDDEKMGEWEAPKVENPDFKEFVPKKIANPDYKIDPNYAEYELVAVGIDIWQVESGSIFSNLLITDDLEHALIVRNELVTTFQTINKSIEEDLKKKAEESGESDEDDDIVDGENDGDFEDEEDDEHDEL